MLTIKRYTASWCQPCKALAPVFEQLAREFSGISIMIIDVDASKDLAQKDGITSVPTVIFEKDGVQVKKIIGVQPKNSYVSAINQYL